LTNKWFIYKEGKEKRERRRARFSLIIGERARLFPTVGAANYNRRPH